MHLRVWRTAALPCTHQQLSSGEVTRAVRHEVLILVNLLEDFMLEDFMSGDAQGAMLPQTLETPKQRLACSLLAQRRASREDCCFLMIQRPQHTSAQARLSGVAWRQSNIAYGKAARVSKQPEICGCGALCFRRTAFMTGSATGSSGIWQSVPPYAL